MAEKKFCKVNGYKMAYVESGSGDPIVFLHGNPTSSFLWRNIISELEDRGRCIAPDLIGMGDSDKLNNSNAESYRFVEHADFLDKFLSDCVDVSENVTLVLHDWGSGLGFWWAYRNQESVKGIVYMESIFTTFTWETFDPNFVEIFQLWRTPGTGETLILEQNLFVENILPSAILRNLTEAEMEAYRAPFAEPGEDRRPTLTWPREIPINGTPADVAAIIDEYSTWMASNDLPKLFIIASPGTFLSNGAQLDFARTWKNQTEVTVAGIHFIQEDSPEEISDAINSWMDTNFVSNDPATSSAAMPEASGVLHILILLLFFLRGFSR